MNNRHIPITLSTTHWCQTLNLYLWIYMYKPLFPSTNIKGIVQPKLKLLSSFSYAHVIQNMSDFLSAEHKRKYFSTPLTSLVWTQRDISQNISCSEEEIVLYAGLESKWMMTAMYFGVSYPFNIWVVKYVCMFNDPLDLGWGSFQLFFGVCVCKFLFQTTCL